MIGTNSPRPGTYAGGTGPGLRAEQRRRDHRGQRIRAQRRAAFLLVRPQKRPGSRLYAHGQVGSAAPITACRRTIVGIGPAFSNLKALKQLGLSVDDTTWWSATRHLPRRTSVIREMEAQSGKRSTWSGGTPMRGHRHGHPNGASLRGAHLHVLHAAGKPGKVRNHQLLLWRRSGYHRRYRESQTVLHPAVLPGCAARQDRRFL